jgi:hypothetical protein
MTVSNMDDKKARQLRFWEEKMEMVEMKIYMKKKKKIIISRLDQAKKIRD